MGQQNVLYRTQIAQKEKYSKLSKEQIEKDYVFNHFRVGSKVDKDVWMHSYLMKETLAQDNCEIVDYIWLKINGKLGNKNNTCPIDLNTIEEDCNITNINNYITEQAQWDKVEW